MYYRNAFSDDPHDGTGIKFGLVVAGIAVIVVRAVQVFGLDLSATIQSITAVLQ